MPSVDDIFERRHAAVFRFFRRMAAGREEAEDLTQETFLRATRTPGRFDDGESDAAWIFRIARNLWLNRRRDRARRPEHQALDAADASVVAFTDPGRTFDLDRALGRLPESDREAFLLREVGGLGYAEIGTTTGASEDAVRSRIHRARLALRAALATPGVARRSTAFSEENER